MKASHLAPLEHKDIVGGAVKQPWNSIAAVGGGRVAAVVDGRREDVGGRKLPTSSQEFVREWRRLKDTSREQYK